MDQLKQLAPPDRAPVELKGLDFKGMFKWLSASVSKVSNSKPGEEALTKLEPLGWANI